MPKLQHQCHGEMGVFCAKNKANAVAQDHHVVTFRQASIFGLRKINHKVQWGCGHSRRRHEADLPRLDHTPDCCRAAEVRPAIMQVGFRLIVGNQHRPQPDHLQGKAGFARPGRPHD